MTTVIYHDHCVDGFTAAWCAWRKLGNNVRYVAAQYGDAPPDCAGDDVLILDFSYPRAVLEELNRTAKSLLVLDHHKSAEAELAGLPYCQFDMTRSGAAMAEDHFYPEDGRSNLVGYVQDRDLWEWKLQDSREVSAYIATVYKGFSDWNMLWDDIECALPDVVRRGKAILSAAEAHVQEQAPLARDVVIGGHSVPTINATFAISELVGRIAEIAKIEGTAPFAAGWFQKQDGQFVYSLRSRGDFDVSEVAKLYGGGGHKNAAGFTVGALL